MTGPRSRCDDVSAMESRTLAPNIRAALSTAVCTLLAVAAHRAAMGGAGVPIAAMVLGALAVFCFARVAAGLGERGLRTIGLLVAGSQIGLHLLFEAMQASGVHAGPASMVSTAGTASTAATAAASAASALGDMASTSGMAGMPSMADASLVPGSAHMAGTAPGMTIAHVLAAVAAAWWLRRGEAALFAAAERARAVLGASWRLLAHWIAGLRPVRRTGPAYTVADLGNLKPAMARVLLFTVIRRGPPAQDWSFSG